jgi:protein-disulfide isomerase
MPSKNARERAARAAAQLAEQKRREQRRRVLSIVGVVVAMVVIVGIGVFVGQHNGSNKAVSETGAPAAGKSDYGLTIGSSSAPHTVVVYEDFLCPFCQQFEAASRDDFTRLAAAGKVYVDYRPFHFLQPSYSKQALNAFAVVKQAYPTGDVAKKFHDLLFENQPSEEGPFPSMSKLVDLAVQAGADKSKVESKILDTSSMSSWVNGATDEALNDAQVQATPTVLLDGQYYQKGNSVADIAKNLVAEVS